MSACAVVESDHDATMRSGVPPVSEERAQAEVLKHYSLAASACELPCERDQMFHLTTPGGEEFLLKIFHPAEQLTAVEMESAILAHLAEADPAIPVPRLVKNADGKVHTVFRVGNERPRMAKILTYLPGVPVARVARSPRLRRNMGSLLARLDLALASFVPSVPERALMWDIRRAAELRRLLLNLGGDSIGNLVAGALNDFEQRVQPHLAGLPQQTIHNDFNLFNVLVDERDPETPTGIIDFGDVIYGPRVFEVAVAANFQAAESEVPLEAAMDLVRAYDAAIRLTRQEQELIVPLVRTRLAMTVLISEWRAALHRENVTYIMKNNPAARLGLQRLAVVSSHAFADALSGLQEAR